MTPDLQQLRRAPHWSYSSLSTLLSICSLKWKFRYVDRIQEEKTPDALFFGGVFHRTMDYINAVRKGGALPVTSNVVDFFTASYDEGVRTAKKPIVFDKLDQQALRDKGIQMVTIMADNVDPDERVVSIAEPFKVQIPGCKPLIGEYDVIVRKNDRHCIGDYKSSAAKWHQGKADTNLQATAYLFAYLQDKNELPDMRFDVVTKAKTPTHQQVYTTRTVQDFKRLVGLIEYAERIVKHGLFAPNDGSWSCPSCPYKKDCAEWGSQLSSAELLAA